MLTQMKVSLTHGTFQHSFNIFNILLTVALQAIHAAARTAVTVKQIHQ